MCGLTGVLSFEPLGFTPQDVDLFNELFVISVLRGQDGSGIFYVGDKESGLVHKNKVYTSWLKHVIPPYSLIMSKDYTKIMPDLHRSRFLIGHARAATVGKVDADTAQPFERGHITLVHNGTLRRIQGMNMHKYKSDSEALCTLLCEESDVKKAMDRVNGAVCIIWYNTKTRLLNIFRNYERPLYKITYGKKMYLSSEKGMLACILDRKYTNFVSTDIKPVEVNKVYSYDHEGNESIDNNVTTGCGWDSWESEYPVTPYSRNRGYAYDNYMRNVIEQSRKDVDRRKYSVPAIFQVKAWGGVNVGDKGIFVPIGKTERGHGFGGLLHMDWIMLADKDATDNTQADRLSQAEFYYTCPTNEELTQLHDEEYLQGEVGIIFDDAGVARFCIKDLKPVSRETMAKEYWTNDSHPAVQ